MKSYYFEGEIDPENTNKLLAFLNENEGGRVYLTSTGGDVYSSDVIVEILNEKCGELVAMGTIFSSAFRIFFESKCKKRIGPTALGMIHLVTKRVLLNALGKEDIYGEKIELSDMKKQSKCTIALCKSIGFTKNEILKLKKGEVWLDNERLQELLTYQNEKNN